MNTKKRFSMMIAFLLAFSVIASMPLQASAANVFADGEYTVPFTVLKDTSNEVSTTADYMVSPAKVHIHNDKATVTVTLNNSSWWQYFKVNSGGLKDVQVISENTSTDKRVVKFDVADLNQLVKGKIHVIVTGIPGFNYDNEYDIRFKFNTASIPAPAPEKPVVTPPAKEEKPPVKPKPEAKPETKPESKPVTKPEVKPESKPTDKKEEVSKTEDKGLVVEKEEKIDSDKEEKAEAGKTETDSSEVEEDEAVEENSADPEDLDIQEEVEVDEEPTIKESAVEEVDSDKDESSNTGLFITLAVVIIALIAGLAAYFASKKRARK